jgi:hypothetical protein
MHMSAASRSAIACCAALAVALACAAPRKPAQEISKAELAIRDAEVKPAPSGASLDLRLAREKLEHAKDALRDEEYTKARRFAEEALVDAQVAEARSDSETARASAQEIEKSIETLRDEADRGAELSR